MQLRVSTWNVEWATPASWATPEILRRIAGWDPEVLCLTETHDELLGPDGYIARSRPDYGYSIREHRRKVMLWSREPWQHVDDVGIASMPPGRYVSGVTQTSLGPVTVIGVCIPWFRSRTEKRRGPERRRPWGDHERYLAGLAAILRRGTPERLIVMGDFNQVVGPGGRAPARTRSMLRECFSSDIPIATGPVTFQGRKSIDHIALSKDLAVGPVDVMSNVFAKRKLSDHFGVVADLSLRRSR